MGAKFDRAKFWRSGWQLSRNGFQSIAGVCEVDEVLNLHGISLGFASQNDENEGDLPVDNNDRL
jgi:hypothetical protein